MRWIAARPPSWRSFSSTLSQPSQLPLPELHKIAYRLMKGEHNHKSKRGKKKRSIKYCTSTLILQKSFRKTSTAQCSCALPGHHLLHDGVLSCKRACSSGAMLATTLSPIRQGSASLILQNSCQGTVFAAALSTPSKAAAPARVKTCSRMRCCPAKTHAILL